MVRDAVDEKIASQTSFTNADISHPIIANDPTVGHRHVRAEIDRLWNAGVIQDHEFTQTMITVYPKPNKPAPARLFHPDDAEFDPSEYTATHQQLHRTDPSGVTQLSAPVTSGFHMMDIDGDDGSQDGGVAITSTVAGQMVSRQCQIMPKEGSINIPRHLIKQAGFNTGDQVGIELGTGVLIVKRGGNDQRVDSEGRIRIHGPKAANIGNPGQTVTVLLVTPSGEDAFISLRQGNPLVFSQGEELTCSPVLKKILHFSQNN